MPTFPIIKINAIEIRFHALIVILAIALIIFDTDFNYMLKVLVRQRDFFPFYKIVLKINPYQKSTSNFGLI